MQGVLSSSVVAALCVLHPAGVRAASHTQPLSREKGCILPPSAPHFAGPVVSLPSLARVSLLPQRYPPAIFIHYLYQDAFGGILESKSKSTVFALRSQKRSLASREQPQGAAEGSSRSAVRPLLLWKPGVWKLGYRRLDCAARRSPGEPVPGRVPSTRAPVLRRLLWLQPVRSQDPFGPTRAFSLCRQISPCFVETLSLIHI